MAWVGEGESRPGVQNAIGTSLNRCPEFFRLTCVAFVDCQESGKTVSAKYYSVNCLKPSIEKVREERPTSGSKNVKFIIKTHVAKIVKDYLIMRVEK